MNLADAFWLQPDLRLLEGVLVFSLTLPLSSVGTGFGSKIVSIKGRGCCLCGTVARYSR